MLSNSNVIFLLILIKYSTLFELTFANSVAVNASTPFDDTKISTVKTVTTSSLSDVAHFIDDASKITRTQKKTAHIKATSTKDPLVTGNGEKFQSTNDGPISIRTITTTTTVPSTASIGHAIELNKVQSLSNKNAENTQNVSSEFEMVSSTLASEALKKILYGIKSTVESALPLPMSKQTSHNQNLRKISRENHLTNTLNSSSLMEISNKKSNNQITDSNDNIESVDYIGGGDNESKIDFVNSDIQQLPQSDAPSMGSLDSTDQLIDSKPRPDAVYFIVAVIGGAKTWARTLSRTLSDMGPPFSDPLGSPLRPIYVDLPTNGR